MSKVKTIFARNLRVLRKRKNLTQMQLAELCDLSTKSIQEIEAGRKFPTATHFEQLAEVLGVKPYQLLLEPNGAATTPDERYSAFSILEEVEQQILKDVRGRIDGIRERLKE